jgi:hypothetical protein
MSLNFKQKMNWIGFLLMGIWLASMVMITGPALAAGKPPTATPTPSGGPTPTPGSGGAHVHYVDCSAATNGDGSQASPWNSLTSPNAHAFGPGDSLLFKRGTTCNGAFVAHNSGSAAAPITLADYGTGALPIIDGGTTNTATINIFEYEYYDIKNLAIRGGSLWGIRVDASTAGLALHHYHLISLDVSAVNHVATARNDSGLIGIYPGTSSSATMSDILVDGVTAHDTTAGAGMTIGGGKTLTGVGITVRNSTAHDVYGDGIVIWQHLNGLVENSVVYHSGMCPACGGGTPVGMWTWNANGVVFQNNESYANQAWSNKDGGGYDIDGQNSNNTFQYNYAHDNWGYCVAFFDWGGTDTVNTVFRYNICANNVQKDTTMGEIYPFTWNGGHLGGVQVYNNTIYGNPAAAAMSGYATMKDAAAYSGSTPNFFKNNIVYSIPAAVAEFTTSTLADYNLYFSPGGVYTFKYGTTSYSSFSAYQAGSGQDAHGKNVNPLLTSVGYHSAGRPTTQYTLQSGSPAQGAGINVCATSCLLGSMGPRDFYGQATGSTHSIGADDN